MAVQNLQHFSVQFSSVQLLSRFRLFATPWTAACPVSLSITNSLSLPKCPLSWWCYPVISSSVVPFSSCPQSFPALGSFQMSQLFASGSQSISFSFNINPSNEYSGLISLMMDWLDLLAAQGTLKSLLQHHSSKAPILWCSVEESLHDYWKNHSLAKMDLSWQSNVFAFQYAV